MIAFIHILGNLPFMLAAADKVNVTCLLGGPINCAAQAAGVNTNPIHQVTDAAQAIKSPADWIIGNVISHLGDIISSFFKAFVGIVFPKELQDAFTNLLFGNSVLAPSDPSLTLYKTFMVPAGAIIAVACAARIIKTILDDRATTANVVVDNLMRAGVAITLLSAPAPPNNIVSGSAPLGYTLVEFIAGNAKSIGFTCLNLILSAYPNGLTGQNAVRAFLTVFSDGLTIGAFPVLGWILIAILVGLAFYCLDLLVMRAIMLTFCVASAPVCIATAVYDPKNKFFQWWLDIFTGVCMIPIVLLAGIGITVAMALSAPPLPIIAPLWEITVLLGGMGFTVKALHKITWSGFTHQSLVGAIGATATGLVVGPQLASEGALMMGGFGLKPWGIMSKLGLPFLARQGPFSAKQAGVDVGGWDPSQQSEGGSGSGSGGGNGAGEEDDDAGAAVAFAAAAAATGGASAAAGGSAAGSAGAGGLGGGLGGGDLGGGGGFPMPKGGGSGGAGGGSGGASGDDFFSMLPGSFQAAIVDSFASGAGDPIATFNQAANYAWDQSPDQQNTSQDHFAQDMFSKWIGGMSGPSFS